MPTAADSVLIGAPSPVGGYQITVNAGAVAQAVTLASGSAELSVTNTLTVGSTLSLDAGVVSLAGGGVIAGGTLAMNGGVLSVDSNGANALDGVRVLGGLAITGGDLQLTGGSSLSGPVSVNGASLELNGEAGLATDVSLSGGNLYFTNPQQTASGPIAGTGTDTIVATGSTVIAGTTFAAGTVFDQAWTVAIGGTTEPAVALTGGALFPQWQADSAASSWIGVQNVVHQPNLPYSFTTTFSYSGNLATALLAGMWYVDDGANLLLNGQTIASGFRTYSGEMVLLNAADGLIVGTNTLTVQMTYVDNNYEGTRFGLIAPQTIAAAAVVSGTGSVGDNANGHGPTVLDNFGTILANVAAGVLTVDPAVFLNDGTLAAAGGGVLAVDYSQGGSLWINQADGLASETNATLEFGGAFTNAGSISASGGALLLGNGNSWSNLGTITATNAAVTLGGTVTTAGVGVLQRSGGSVSLDGTLVNTGATLDTTGGTFAGLTLSGGTIVGGTVISSPGLSGLQETYNAANALVDVAVTGGLSVDGGQLRLAGGSSLSGPSQIVDGGILEINGEAGLAADVSLNNGFLAFANPQQTASGPIAGTGTDTIVATGSTVIAGTTFAAGTVFDQAWTVAIGGTTEPAVALTGGALFPQWQADSAASSWIGVQNVVHQPNLPYSFTTTFSYSGNLATALLAGMWYVDDGANLLLNGQTIASGFRTYSGEMVLLNAADGLIVGTNTLTVQMTYVDNNYEGTRFGLIAPQTIAAAAVVSGTGSVGDNANGHGPTVLDNFGTILANVAAGVLTVDPAVFLNDGTLAAAGGGVLAVDYSQGGSLWINQADGLASETNATLEFGGAFTNAGSISASGGALLLGNGNSWSNLGTITATNAAVTLGGTVTTAGVGVLQRSGGSVSLDGTLVNTGATLDTTGGTFAGLTLSGGTIVGGTVISSPGLSGLQETYNAANALVDVAVTGGLSVDGGQLRLAGGSSLSGPSQIVDGGILEINGEAGLAADVSLNNGFLAFANPQQTASGPIAGTGTDTIVATGSTV
ncbi:MAG: beta strand repeat-containing protein, partial [Acetobacteraceae bacterium]